MNCYDKVIEIKADDIIVWNNKGMILINFGKYDDAIYCYEKAISINSHLANAYYNKYVALSNVERY
ncbi:MAG TPA: tetratricopeptide repeat protein [Nitrososphaeraceae archaeon]|nr:tetratricopeptide repeat protein [Nitrososphaeraceae archaeon]